ncbi:MAG: MFS transporter [Verrucomicrobiota bacterium]
MTENPKIPEDEINGANPPPTDVTGHGQEEVKGRSVQDYIDETPMWPDQTRMTGSPMTNMQWLVWALACFGKFFEGMVVFMTGVALPLMMREFGLGATEKGFIAAAPLLGILIGATALGSLADVFGRKKMFIIELILFAAFVVALTFCDLLPGDPLLWIVFLLFGTGLALGCDYPTAHMVISECIPSTVRGRMVLSAFGFQAVGALAGVAVGFVVLSVSPELSSWRWMYAATLIPAIPVIIGRFFITKSAHWLVSQGRYDEAEAELARLLKRNPPYPKTIKLARKPETAQPKKQKSFSALFRRKHRGRTILASLPWFLQDLGTYGIGIFTPIILATVIGQERIEHATSVSEIVYNAKLAAQGAIFIDVLLIVGIIFAIFLADKVGRMRLQIAGFIGCAVGLFIAALSLNFTEGSTMAMVLIFTGFMLFSFMTNMGPNAMTYLIAGEVFPTKLRGKGAGFAASFAKIGACLTAFLFPVFLAEIGTAVLLYCLVGTSLLGALVTWAFAIETKGLNLEKLDAEEPAQLVP